MTKSIPLARVKADDPVVLRQFLQKDRVVKPPKAVAPIKLPKRIWRPLSTNQRMLIVRMRWTGLSFKDIGILTKINQVTCRAVYRSYYVNG